MSTANDLYGFKNESFENVANAIERTLNMSWTKHHSSFLGEYYQYGNRIVHHLILQKNYLEEDEDWMESKFIDFPILLYSNNTEDYQQRETTLLNSIPSATILRRKIYDE
ncbi:MAG: hypothetical protein H7Y09_03835 [Chitinophagaceae bacterium]|nr:hypothetical protein [Anaerolineae bacterium]